MGPSVCTHGPQCVHQWAPVCELPCSGRFAVRYRARARGLLVCWVGGALCACTATLQGREGMLEMSQKRIIPLGVTVTRNTGAHASSGLAGFQDTGSPAPEPPAGWSGAVH